jgi:hypothetical protein
MLLDPLKSLADFQFYKDLPRKSFMATFLYLAYLGLLFTIAYTLMFSLRYGPRLDEAAEWAATNIPPLTLADGKLSSPLQEPVRIVHPKAEQLAFIIDTNRTEPVTPFEMRASTVVAFIAQSAVYYFASKDELRVHDLSLAKSPKPIQLDAEFYRSLGAFLKKALYPATMLITWMIFMVWKHLAALVYSVIALLLNGILSAGLPYSSLYRAAVYAQTPAVVLQGIVMFLPSPVPYFGLLLLIVVTVYLWQAILQMKAPAGPRDT